MAVNYIKHFPQNNFNAICSKMRMATGNKKPLWCGTIYVGTKPVYIECNIKQIAEKIEKYFTNVLPNQRVDGAKKLYILDNAVQDFVKTPDKNQYMVCFLSDKITETPDLIVAEHYIFLKNDSVFYISGPQSDEMYYLLGENHLLTRIFNYIFKPNETIVLHGAVVGDNKTGILITGLSGAGKSTLAGYCVAMGMKFIGDDRVVLERKNGQIYAYPLYNTLSLKDKIDGIDITNTIISKNKNVFILDKKNIYNRIELKYIIEPIKKSNIKPEIFPWEKAPILTRICQDYSHFSRLVKSTDLLNDYHNINNLLSGVDYHIIQMSDNIQENAKCLVNFIKTKKAQ